MTDLKPDTPSHSIWRHQVLGFAAVALLIGGLGSWAAATDISGAVIAPGKLVVASNVKKVQHPEGGIVGEIFVRDGDHVKAGDVVVRLDATITRANLAIVEKRLTEMSARKARLEAERDGANKIKFPDKLRFRASDPDVDHITAGEQKLFKLRRVSRAGQKAQLAQRIAQLKEEIGGLRLQADSKAREIEFIKTELTGARELWEKDLMPVSKLMTLEREAARIDGERGKLIATMARAKAQVAETKLQIIQIDQDLASEVAKEMREIDAQVGEFIERRVAAQDQLKRVDIRAPQSGVIHESAVHTVGGVINASDPIMLVVPEADNLTVEAKVAPQDIDQLLPGQDANLRFSAFNQRTTPEIAGIVSRISADITTDDYTGESYYKVRVSLADNEISRLGDVELVPGMPVEVFVKTGDRRVLSYLVKPLSDQITRAFREE